MTQPAAEKTLPNVPMELHSRRQSFWGSALRLLITKHSFEFFLGGGIIFLVCAAALLAPIIEGVDPNFQNARAVSQAPSFDHLMGTDNFGRDVFSRVVNGAQVSLKVGFSAVILGIAAATIIGMVSGYAGGWIDMVLQRVVDVLMAFPTLILILLVVAILGASTTNVILAIALFIIAAPSRVVRAEVLSVKTRQYIEAARAMGATDTRIIFSHIFPNIVHVVIIMVSVNLGGAIMTEASLSFLGLGVPPPAPSWGNLIAGAGTAFIRLAPWMVFAPGIVLAATIYAFNMLGDALRDVLDPRLRV